MMAKTYWDQYRLLAHKLLHGEFGHQIPINYSLLPGKNKEQYHTQIKPLKGIISAYINTSGGCVDLQNDPNPHLVVPDKLFDIWRNNIKDQFTFIQPKSLQSNIKFEYNHGKPFAQVKPCSTSTNLVTLVTHLYTRQKGSNEHVSSPEYVTKLMNQAIKPHKELQTKPTYKYKEKLPGGEDDHTEYKHFTSACSARELLAIINDVKKRICFSLFGMANLQGGGKVLIGVDDDGEVRGQPLSESEEEEFKEGMLNFYREDPIGMKRYCNDQEFHPVEGTHFRVQFIPVELPYIPISHCGKKGCKECPNKRRVLIKISVFQIGGVLLMQQPECYKVRDSGKIIQISMDEWYETHKQAKPAASHHQLGIGAKNTVAGRAEKRAKNTIPQIGNPPEKASPPDSQQLKESPDHAYKGLSFRHNSSQFNPGPAEAITPESIAKGVKDCEILKLRQPCNFHPSCDALVLRYPSIKEKLDVIKKEIGEKGSFALADSSLFSCFSHDLEDSDIPSGSLMSPGLKPGHHLIDIFAADDTGAKNIFCLFEGKQTHHNREKSYGLQLVRVMKKRLTEVLKKHGKGSEVCIKLTILRMESDDLEVYQSSHLSEADDVELEMMEIAVASTFLAKESLFKDKMGKDITIQFSLEQAGLLKGSDDMYAPVTIITGSPGTGKTLIAQCLCEKFGKDQSIYVCSTSPLEEFVKFVGKAETHLLKKGEQTLLEIIQGLLVRRRCIVIDEGHMIECEVIMWEKIFDLFRKNQEYHLFIFLDSEFHDYQNVHATSQLIDAIKSYKKESNQSGVVHVEVLRVNFRNSQVIGSYLHAIQPTPPTHIKFKGTTVGNDVSVHVVHNLWENSANNGLLLHVKDKIKTTLPSDIAILVGWTTEEKVKKDLDLFSSVFRDHLPQIKVHRAGDFPPDGIALDSVWNFTGLDRDVIILITPANEDAREMLQNVKYKTAVVSRGISTVEFLQEAVVEHNEALGMKFDQPPKEGQNVVNKQSSEAPSTSKDSQIADDLHRAAIAGNVDRISALLKQGADVNGFSEGKTALCRAALSGHLEVMKLLFSQGADIELVEFGPLCYAAQKGHLQCVDWLLQNGADINGLSEGDTALCEAAQSGHLEVIKLLFSKGADIELGKYKPLYAAAQEGHLQCVEWLLQKGADINGLSVGDTALCEAARSGHLEVMKRLFSQGANIELGEEKPLYGATQEGHLQCVEWLLQKGADVNGLSEGDTPLRAAAMKGHLEVMKLLFSQGADIELGKYKPLYIAAQEGHLQCVEWLLQKGADVNGLGEGYTALCAAAGKGHLEVMKLLFSQGADIELGEEKPLYRAAQEGRLQCVEWLLQNGADVNGLSDGFTALCRAALNGHLEVMKLLFSQGAGIELGEGKPLYIAAHEGHLQCVEWLLENGADINGLSDGVTALCAAAVKGQLEVMKLLFSQGADIELGKWKPLYYAAQKGHLQCVEWLLQNGASQKTRNRALRLALKKVQNVPERWSDQRKADRTQTVETLRLYGAVADEDDEYEWEEDEEDDDSDEEEDEED